MRWPRFGRVITPGALRARRVPMSAKGSAEWKGDVPTGTGTFTAGDTIRGGYTYKSRFEDGPGSNPEQLIAAAHAACFSMALSNILAQSGTPPESVHTDRDCDLEACRRRADHYQDCSAHGRKGARAWRRRVHRARTGSQGWVPGEQSARRRPRDHPRSIADRMTSSGVGAPKVAITVVGEDVARHLEHGRAVG